MDDNIKTVSAYELKHLNEYTQCPEINRMMLRRVFIMLLKDFFSNKNHFNSFLQKTYCTFNYTYSDIHTDPDGKSKDVLNIIPDYQYADDMAKTEGNITTTTSPKIIVGIDNIEMEKLPVVNMMYEELPDGTGITEGVKCSTNIRISSYAPSYIDCDIMSYLICYFLSGLRQHFVTNWKIDDYFPIGITKPMAINPDNTQKIFKSECIFKLKWQMSWISRVESSRIRHIMIDTKFS